MSFVSYIAETAGSNQDLFGALGIDWRLLILQIVAFLILVFLLGKFVYPWLMKSVDERQANIEEAAKAATKAQKAAAESKEETAALLAEARKEAAEIVSTAKLEATEMVSASEKRAKNTAEKIVSDARAQLDKDVEAARITLHNETLDLIALATGKVVGQTNNKAADKDLIASVVKDIK